MFPPTPESIQAKCDEIGLTPRKTMQSFVLFLNFSSFICSLESTLDETLAHQKLSQMGGAALIPELREDGKGSNLFYDVSSRSPFALYR